MQTTSHLLMIRPVNFSFNTETAVNNAFQVAGQSAGAQEKASKEFDDFVAVLREHGIDITVINDTADPYTPDSIFPNNWISFHTDGSIFLYPMFAKNRRQERKAHVIETIEKKFSVANRVDLTGFEKKNLFLEGTGSMVLDRDFNLAYACLSERTDITALAAFCEKTGYAPVSFHAYDDKGKPIYHTNVMMCVAHSYVVICLDSITDKDERALVTDKINRTGKTIVEISIQQMNHFAGNMLQVQNDDGEKFLVMSSQAFQSLNTGQVQTLQSFNEIIHSSLSSIETNGGGSARCMMAEIFLPAK